MPPELAVSSLVEPDAEPDQAAASSAKASEALSAPGSAMVFLASFPVYPFI